MKKTIKTLLLCIALVSGGLVGSSIAKAGGDECGTCQENPTLPGYSFCNYIIEGGGCGQNVGMDCVQNCGL